MQVCCRSHHMQPNPSSSEVMFPQGAEPWARTWRWAFPPPCWTISGDPSQLIFPTYKKASSMLRPLRSALSPTNARALVQRQIPIKELLAQELQLNVCILIQPLLQPSANLKQCSEVLLASMRPKDSSEVKYGVKPGSSKDPN